MPTSKLTAALAAIIAIAVIATATFYIRKSRTFVAVGEQTVEQSVPPDQDRPPSTSVVVTPEVPAAIEPSRVSEGAPPSPTAAVAEQQVPAVATNTEPAANPVPGTDAAAAQRAPQFTFRDPRELGAAPSPPSPPVSGAAAGQPAEISTPVPREPTDARSGGQDGSSPARVTGLFDRRPLVADPGPRPATERAKSEPTSDTQERQAGGRQLTFNDSRQLGPTAGDRDPSRNPAGRTASALPTEAFRDARALAPVRLQDPRALQRSEQPGLPTVPAPAAPQQSTPAAVAAAPPQRPRETTITTAAVAPLARPGAACEAPTINTEPLDGGLMRLLVVSQCRAGQDVQFAYGGAVLIRRLDATGRLDLTLDCFVGAATPVQVTLADGTREAVPVAAKDLDKVSKVAVVWRAPVNLDLHAFEYASTPGQPGHVWARTPSSRIAAHEIMQAGQRGRGFLSTIDDGGSIGDKLEVYTFLHHDAQSTGVVAMGLDYETRGELPSGVTCGSGPYAEVAYQVSMLNRQGQLTRESGVLAAAPCGVRIGPQVRYDPLLLPTLRVRRP